MDSSNFFNPEDAAKSIRAKSFLRPRDAKRQSGSQFFQDNKIRTCSFVKQTKGSLKAVPFYDKRNNTIYPTKSTVMRSWSAAIHSTLREPYAGSGMNKPLVAYNPQDRRNLMKINDFRPPYPNSSKIEFGVRNVPDNKHFVTNYNNNYINVAKKMPTNHPGIEAYQNKWLKSRIAK